MFENIKKLFKKSNKKEALSTNSRETAKERLHLVLMQDRANVSADFLDLMRQEIIEVIKKYIDIDESALDVRLKNQANEDGTQGAPVLYANIPILNIKDENKRLKKETDKEDLSKNAGEQDNKEKEENALNEKEDSTNTEKKENSSKKINNKEKSKETNKKSPKIDETKENEIEEKNNDIVEEKIEDTKQEDKKSEEEIEKQEDEKIEEAKKIVAEENKDLVNNEVDNKE